MRSLGQIGAGVSLFAVLLASAGSARAVLSSYAVAAHDDPGSSTGAAAVALGVPDYRFVDDAGLGFGGANADVFAPGESTVLTFPVPIRNVPGQPDLVVWAFVGGAGASDDAQVEVEVSVDGATFLPAGSFHTADGRDPAKYAPTGSPAPFEADFAAVKQFPIEIGGPDTISYVRLRNVAGTAEGLRLDAVEALQPVTHALHAFEIRLEQYRDPLMVGRFRVRLKNLAEPGGEGIRELRIVRPPSNVQLEDTDSNLYAQYGRTGRLICTEHCVPDTVDMQTPPSIPFSRHVWSLDGVTEAPAGEGLDPGRQAAHLPAENFDTDFDPSLLQDFGFEVEFTDGGVETFGFDENVVAEGEVGALYQKYVYSSATPTLSGPQPAYVWEFVPEPAGGAATLASLAALAGVARSRRR